MLVISRKQGESLIIDIGDQIIEITVTEIGKQVRMGIDAPKGCKIWRKELYATIESNKQAIISTSPESLRSILQSLNSQNKSK